MGQSNYSARQSLNRQYANIKGASSINDVAMGFGRGWIVFAVLSSMASAFSFYQDFNQSLGMIATILIVLVLAIALEAFKHLSIKGMFSDMHLLSRSLVTVVAIGLIGVSFYTHYKSIQTFQKNLVSADLKTEIAYQRDLQKMQNSQINTILQSNSELAKALNNGSTADDHASSMSVKSNNNLIATLQRLSAQNNMHNTTLLLEQSRSTAKTTASAILVIFIMVEIMALFSILSKIIVVDNVSTNLKEFFGVMDRLDELESNTYESLGLQKMRESQERIKAVQRYQEHTHQEELTRIANSYHTMSKRIAQTEPSAMGYTTGIADWRKPYKSPENQGVEGGMAPKLERYKAETKVKVLDLNLYDEAEQRLLKILWDNGNVKSGDNLVSRRQVLKEVGDLRGKSGVLTNLYEKLLQSGYVKFTVRYVAYAELVQKVYQERSIA